MDYARIRQNSGQSVCSGSKAANTMRLPQRRKNSSVYESLLGELSEPPPPPFQREGRRGYRFPG